MSDRSILIIGIGVSFGEYFYLGSTAIILTVLRVETAQTHIASFHGSVKADHLTLLVALE